MFTLVSNGIATEFTGTLHNAIWAANMLNKIGQRPGVQVWQGVTLVYDTQI